MHTGWLHAHAHKANVNAWMGLFEGGVEAPVRVLLADDDAGFLESLQPLIEHQPELTVIGLAANGLAAIELADALAPDAVVIDLHMPLVDGVTAVAEVDGVTRAVRLDLLPEVVLGDYVLIHAGLAIARVDAEHAEETLTFLRSLADEVY